MIQQQDILIIGGGVIGVCSAYYLNELGYSVTLLEKDDIAAGSSYGNAGLIVPSHLFPIAAPGVPLQGMKWLFDPESPLYIKPRLDLGLMRWMWHFLKACRETPMQHAISTFAALYREGLGLYDELAALENLDFGYETKGGLFLYRTQAGFQHGLEEARELERHGIEAQMLKDLDAVKEIESRVSDSIIGGMYIEQDAHLIPDRFVKQMAQLIESRGVKICRQTEVLDFHVAGQRLSHVTTSQGEFKAGVVVMATGAWSPLMVRKLGFNLPIQPAKGYSITMKRLQNSPSIPVHLVERKVIATPMGDHLRLAGTLELAGHDSSINERRVSALRRAMREYLPEMNGIEEVEVWYGWRPLTPDTIPIIGRSPKWDNLIVATGHGMLGMSLGPVTGKLVADMVAGNANQEYLSALRVDRY